MLASGFSINKPTKYFPPNTNIRPARILVIIDISVHLFTPSLDVYKRQALYRVNNFFRQP